MSVVQCKEQAVDGFSFLKILRYNSLLVKSANVNFLLLYRCRNLWDTIECASKIIIRNY